jgi:hypothetical protein
MATATIIDFTAFRQNRASTPEGPAEFHPAPDRLWEYLANNIKINAADFPPPSPQDKAV